MGFWSDFINKCNDELIKLGKQDITEIKKQNEFYAKQEIAKIQSMQYLNIHQKEYFVSQILSELKRRQKFQDKREIMLDLTKILNEVSKACNEKENKS